MGPICSLHDQVLYNTLIIVQTLFSVMQYGPVGKIFAALGDAFTAIEYTSGMNLIHRDGLLSGTDQCNLISDPSPGYILITIANKLFPTI